MKKITALLLAALPLLMSFDDKSAEAATGNRRFTVQVIRTDGKPSLDDGLVTVYYRDKNGQQRSTYSFTDKKGTVSIRLPAEVGSSTIYVEAGYISDLWCESKSLPSEGGVVTVIYRGINPDWMDHDKADHDY